MSFYRLHLYCIGLNSILLLVVSAVLIPAPPDIVTLSHLYRLDITHLYCKFFNISIWYYIMTKWIPYRKINIKFQLCNFIFEFEMHLFHFFLYLSYDFEKLFIIIII